MIRKLLQRYHTWIWDLGPADNDVEEIAYNEGATLGSKPYSKHPGRVNKIKSHYSNRQRVADESLLDNSYNSTQFRVHRANGGVVIETARFIEQKDQYLNELYVIDQEQDLGQTLSRIITLESLKS